LQVRWEKLCFIDVADITMHVLHIGYKQEEGLVIINLKFIAFSDLMIVNLRFLGHCAYYKITEGVARHSGSGL
jgi:hypothetical protein